MWSAFSRLGDHLAARARTGERRVTLTFGELEGVLGRPLPSRARSAVGWWRNDPPTAVRRPGDNYRWYGWLSVGWEAEPDLLAGAVTFRRRDDEPPP